MLLHWKCINFADIILIIHYDIKSTLHCTELLLSFYPPMALRVLEASYLVMAMLVKRQHWKIQITTYTPKPTLVNTATFFPISESNVTHQSPIRIGIFPEFPADGSMSPASSWLLWYTCSVYSQGFLRPLGRCHCIAAWGNSHTWIAPSWVIT